MHTLYKKILPIILLLSCIQMEAQLINWNIINLAGGEAKIRRVVGSQPVQNNLLIDKIFDTKEGKINVYLPPLSSTVTLSGTVYLEPTGRDSSRNLMALQSFNLSLGNQVIPVQRGSFQLQLPNDPSPGNISLQLKNSTGQLIKSEQLPVTKPSLSNS